MDSRKVIIILAEVVALTALSGCGTSGKTVSRSRTPPFAPGEAGLFAMSIWCDKSSSPWDREWAVSQLISEGEKVGKVIWLLGHPDKIVFVHGQRFLPPYTYETNGVTYFQPTKVDNAPDEDWLFYRCKSGESVMLRFTTVSVESRWEDERFLSVEIRAAEIPTTPLIGPE